MIGHHIHGHGPVRAIVLPGWLGDWRVFEPILPALDEDRFTFAFMDVRGYGASKALAGPFDMATIAADALVLADHLGWERFSAIGHSMGGKAALRLAVDAPDRVEAIIGLTPVWAAPAPFDAATLGFFRHAAVELEARAAILDNTTGGRAPKAWSRTLAARSFAVSTVEAFAAYLESWALDDFETAARGLPHPTLVVTGAHDAGVPEALVRDTWLSALPNARGETLAEAGHYPMVEAPLRLAAVIERFLNPSPGRP